MEENYKLYVNPWEIDEVQKLEKELFVIDLFEYNRNILVFPFKSSFDNYYFLPFNYLFRKREDYEVLTEFLAGIESPSFFISAPPYAVLYPLEVSVTCPYPVYQNAPAYGLEETMDSGTRPLQHPRRGVGFATIPDVFMYDRSKQWAILNNDSNQITIIGVNNSVKERFESSFSNLKLLTVSESITVMETFQTGNMSAHDRNVFADMFNTH